MKKYELIDFFKGFSIFTIVIYHALQRLDLSPLLQNAIRLGGTGVHLFLLISGLGLYLSYKHKPISYPAFLRKRFLKIYLPYVLIVLVSAGIGLWLPIWDENSWYALGGHVFLYKMFDNNIIGSYGYQLWFLSTILQFYLVFHLLAWFKLRSRNRVFLLTSILISIGWGVLILLLGKSELRNWNSFFPMYLWEFMLGMVFASLLYHHRLNIQLKPFHFLAIAVLTLAIFAWMALKGDEAGKIFNDFPALIGYTSVAAFVYFLRLKVVNAFFLYTGKISFALYLVHMLVFVLVAYVFRLMQWDAGVLVAVLSVLLSYGLGHVYQRVIVRMYGVLRL